MLLGAVGCSGTTPTTTKTTTTGAQKSLLKGSHFDVSSDDGLATEGDARRILERAERLRTRYVGLLGADRVGNRHIRVRLAGEGRKCGSSEQEFRIRPLALRHIVCTMLE